MTKSRIKTRSTRKVRSKVRSKKLSAKCKKFLQKKIRINMGEYKSGRFKSRAQALAVSYSQMRKKFPKC